ncbi:uncharacterized protein BDV17DRAFT_289006 [Aspergillus undulatus]|uniref:uncharacterized protein n=1 Tax=Aspergillus undulatus TaxID=1810928 RepID=UPI003CCD8816
MARMRAVLFFVALISRVVLADETCERIANLPACAKTCLIEPGVSGTCTDISRGVCLAQYESVTSCYESHCELRDYLYAMNTTNTLCEIPPRRRQSTQIAVGSTFIALATIIMGLRLAGRPPFSDSFGIDDVIGLIAYCTAMVDTAVMLAGVRIGWGTDMWALSKDEIVQQMKVSPPLLSVLTHPQLKRTQLFYIGILYFYFSVTVTKLAILFFYLRIFTTPTFKKTTYTLMTIISAYAVVVIFQSAFDCTPPSYFWARFDGESQGSCLSYTAFKVMPPINIALDVVVMVLPLPLLLRLNLPWVKKIRVVCMFSVGLLIIVAGTLRMSHLYSSITAYNITYNGGEISYFGVIEADVSVICTCMPAIAAFLKRLFPRWFGSSTGSGLTYRTYHTGSATLMSPRTTVRGSTTMRGSTQPTKPMAGSAEDIQLLTLLDEDVVRRPEKCLSPV